MTIPLLTYINTHRQDAVNFKADALMLAAGDDLFLQESAVKQICEMLSHLNGNTFLQAKYAGLIGKKHKIKPALLIKDSIKIADDRDDKATEQHLDEGEKALPKWVDKDKYYALGFDSRIDGPENTGIYFSTSAGPRQLTNFTIKPLIHVFTQDDDNRRLTEVHNGYQAVVIQLPSKAFSSMDAFESILMDQGVYFTYDGFSKSHLNKLKSVYLKEYPKCYELKTLGWQPEGFFAFTNLIYTDKVVEFNDYGVAAVGENKFLSMGASSALKDVRAEDDIYKNDKYLKYVLSDVDFETWADLFYKVYEVNGMMGIAFTMMAAFKDIIFRRNNNFPILYAYGAVQAGKSKFVESIANVFTHQMLPFNLNQGTDYAFFERLERFRNVPVIFNEFDENSIKEEWYRAFKGAFEGEGRAKGAGRKNKTKTQEVNCAPIILGQYLSTKDDNSVLSRSIPRKFLENNARTEVQEKIYTTLKMHEQTGISSIVCEILNHRKYIGENYNRRFETVSAELKAAFTKEEVTPKNRVIENFTSALTMVHLMANKVKLPFTYADFFSDCKSEIIKLSSIISESNTLSEFWKVMEFLIDQDIIEQGYHYKVEVHSDVRIAQDKTTVKKTFEEPKKLLFIRFSTIHALYVKEKRNQTGKSGQNEVTILTYMKDQAYYIGNSPGGGFKSKKGESMNTSSFVFDYDLIGANLERTFEAADNRQQVELDGFVFKNAEVIDVIGTPKTFFQLYQDESYKVDGQPISKKVFTRCMWANIDRTAELKENTRIIVSGLLNRRQGSTGEFREMEVLKVELAHPELGLVTAAPEEDLPF